MAEGKKIKLKLKKKEEAAVSEAPPVRAPIPSTKPPKITLKGLKIRIEEVNLAKRK